MCFGKKPKMKSPKITQPIQNTAPPISEQTPKVVDGADAADAKRSKKRAENPNAGLSLFQIQLLPGATTTTGDEPGASGNLEA